MTHALAFLAGVFFLPTLGVLRVMLGDRSGDSGRFKHWMEE